MLMNHRGLMTLSEGQRGGVKGLVSNFVLSGRRCGRRRVGWVITLLRPSSQDVERYVAERMDVEPTARPALVPPAGFRVEGFTKVIGTDLVDFRLASEGLEAWAAHWGSGVDVFPADADLAIGSTVGIRTRQLGLWVVAACRVESAVDEATRRGFVYSTLPGHPACGYESFVVRFDSGEVVFDIEAVSKPGLALVKFATPLTRRLQRHATEAYLDALHRYVLARR